MKIGIDFGTSFSLPAVPYLDTNIILLPSGKYGIPSVFYYDEWEGVLVGEDAENAGQGEEAKNLKREIKLELNSNFVADGRSFSAKQIVGYILNNVKENALAAAKAKLINDDLEGVVISVPAAFSHNEKEFIKQAAELPVSQGGPGLNVLGVIKEPVAAALAYFKTSLADKTRILIYDLGGGTCDVAIVEANSAINEKYTVIDSDMKRIGGKDWDSRLEDYICREVEKQSGLSIANNPGYKEKIKRAAISTKHSFSEKVGESYRDRVRARVEVNGKSYNVPITKVMFDELTMGLLNQTIQMACELVYRNNAYPIDKVVCVGGSSNMPQVMEGLKKAFPGKEIQIYEPEKAIAIGAGIYAQFCDGKDSFLSDIASFSYGIKCWKNDEHKEEIIVNLIKMGDRLPITKEHGFVSSSDDQRTLGFKVFENNNNSNEFDYKAGELSSIMQLDLEIPQGSPKGTPARVYMTLTTDGILVVRAEDKNGHSVKIAKQLSF